jgi:hypothetical protein
VLARGAALRNWRLAGAAIARVASILKGITEKGY